MRASGDLAMLEHLPAHLAERCRVSHLASTKPINPDGQYVLCWLHHAIRDHENAALDTALELSHLLERPVLVYQGLAGRHRFNSIRHHAFILEGARDLQAALTDRGISYALHVPDDPSAPSPLRRLVGQACIVVTEDYPAPPFPAWTQTLTRRSSVPVIEVDACCVMPMRMNSSRPTRAYAFREFAQREWHRRLNAPWPTVQPEHGQVILDPDILGFEPVDLQNRSIDDLCAKCHIDQSVTPVQHLRGGSVAGYKRWERFKRAGLGSYAKRRNNALDMEGVSGLSPYLHHGHVSAMRIARECLEMDGSGPEKFLDELLVWRELAHGFCALTHPSELETLKAIPAWAQRTLLDRIGDRREHLFESTQLEQAQTGDSLWDAAQHSLLLNGELHNNLRMTWGKAILGWTPNPAEALRILIELNHRYALDGNDPNSYGGLLWCLGQFDRPFSPEQPVIGTVRPRDTSTHAQRLDPAAFRRAVLQRSGAQDHSESLFSSQNHQSRGY